MILNLKEVNDTEREYSILYSEPLCTLKTLIEKLSKQKWISEIQG